MESRKRISGSGIAQILALLAFVPATSYPLGLLVLAVQLNHAYSSHMPSSVFEASLVSKTLVFWLGFRAICEALSSEETNLIWMSIGLLLGGLLGLADYWLGRRRQGRRSQSTSATSELDDTASRVARLGFLLPRNKARHKDPSQETGDDSRTPIMTSPPYPVISFVATFIIAYAAISLALDVVAALRHPTNQHSATLVLSASLTCGLIVFGALILIDKISLLVALLAIVTVYFGVLASAIVLASESTPQLPSTIIQRSNGQNLHGQFISHSDGHWFVVDQNGDLQAVPDRSVEQVTILGH